MTEIYLKDDQLQQVVQSAIFEMMTPETKERLVKDAIRELLEKRKDGGYGSYSRLTRLQEAFATAIEEIARPIVKKFLQEDDQARTQLEAIVHKALGDALADDSTQYRLQGAIAAALVGKE